MMRERNKTPDVLFLLTLATQARTPLIEKKYTAGCNRMKSVCCTCLDCIKENSTGSEDIKTNMQLLSCELLIMSGCMLNISSFHLLCLPMAPCLQRAIVSAFFILLKMFHSHLFVLTALTNQRARLKKKRRQTKPLDVLVPADC